MGSAVLEGSDIKLVATSEMATKHLVFFVLHFGKTKLKISMNGSSKFKPLWFLNESRTEAVLDPLVTSSGMLLTLQQEKVKT